VFLAITGQKPAVEDSQPTEMTEEVAA
jgi:hypothetical protein